MSDPVRFSRVGGVAVITLDNPPVNALGFAVRDALARHLSAAAADPDLTDLASAPAAAIATAPAPWRRIRVASPEPDATASLGTVIVLRI